MVAIPSPFPVVSIGRGVERGFVHFSAAKPGIARPAVSFASPSVPEESLCPFDQDYAYSLTAHRRAALEGHTCER
jgi:hypothetical protein